MCSATKLSNHAAAAASMPMLQHVAYVAVVVIVKAVLIGNMGACLAASVAPHVGWLQ